MQKNSSQKGFLKAIVVIVIALFILSYFGLDFKVLFSKNGFQNLLGAAQNFFSWLFSNFLYYANAFIAFLKSVQH